MVLLPGEWTAEDAERFRAWLAESLSPDPDIRTGWVLRKPRNLGLVESSRVGPMLVEPGPCEWDDIEESAFPTTVGFLPVTEIVLAAAVNGNDDHRFLAQLAVAIARRHDGVIDLGGTLPVPPPPGVSPIPKSDLDWQRWDDLSRAIIATLPGRWFEIPYRTASDEIGVGHVVDADLLTSWLDHPLFRMVK